MLLLPPLVLCRGAYQSPVAGRAMSRTLWDVPLYKCGSYRLLRIYTRAIHKRPYNYGGATVSVYAFFCRISTLRIFPLMVLGSSVTNSMILGYL